MRKVFFLVSVCVLFIFSCRKIYTTEKNDLSNEAKIAEIQVRQFLATELGKTKGKSKEKLADVISKIDFSTIRVEPFKHEVFSDIKEVIIMDLPGINVDDFLNLSKTETIEVRGSSTDTLKGHASITKVVFFQTASQIKEGNILHLSSPISNKEELDRDIVSIIMAKKQGFTGRYCTNFLTKRLQNDFRWKNGKVVSSTVLRPKGGRVINNNVAVSAQVCYDWYKTTTYFYTDGSYFIDEVYLGRTCSGSADPGENQEFQTDLNGGALLDEEPIDSNCLKNKQLAMDVGFSNMISFLRDSTDEPDERGYAFYRSSSGSLEKTFIPGSGGATLISTLPQNNDYEVVFHNHLDSGSNSIFALNDVAAFYQTLYKGNRVKSILDFKLGVVLSDGSVFILQVTNLAEFEAFGINNLSTSNVASWISSNPHPNYENKATQIQRFLFAIRGSGLTLFETSINGLSSGFQKVSLEHIPLGSVENINFYATKRTNCPTTN